MRKLGMFENKFINQFGDRNIAAFRLGFNPFARPCTDSQRNVFGLNAGPLSSGVDSFSPRRHTKERCVRHSKQRDPRSRVRFRQYFRQW